MNKGIILIADVENKNKIELSEIKTEDYKIKRICEYKAALNYINKNRTKLVIVITNNMQLFMNLKYKRENELFSIIFITENNMEEKIKAYELGAYEVITKPFNEYILKKRIQNAVKLYEHNNNMEQLVNKRTEQIKKDMMVLKNINREIVETLSSIVEFRNMESGGHIRRIREYTAVILKHIMELYPEYRITADDAEIIEITSAMHDIGKIAIPDKILQKKGSLDDDEMEIMKRHTTLGAEIVNKIAFKGNEKFRRYCFNIAKYHHERYDGKGYPCGLAGEEIPISAQIVALADVYDALVSKRVYKESYNADTACKMILNDECGVFSDKIKECLIKAKKEIKEITEIISE